MEGVVLDFNSEAGEGLIRSENSERYVFTREEWKSESLPKAQMKVDFEANDGKAMQIYLLSGTGFEMPNVDISSIKDKFSEAGNSVSNNTIVKKIVENGLFNKVSLVFIVIALIGSLTDTLTLGEFGHMFGSGGTIEGTSLSGFGIGWLLVISLIALFVVSAVGFSSKVIRLMGLACIFLFIWQGYSLGEEVYNILRMMDRYGAASADFISFVSVAFVLISFIFLIAATVMPKTESPAFKK